mgnify:CR=1 FL=1
MKSFQYISRDMTGPEVIELPRGGWRPFCNHQVRQVTMAYDKFQQRHVTPVLISVDQTDGAMLVKEAYEIPFPVLSDSDLAAHESFKAVIELDNTGYEKYKKFGVDLEAWSGLDHHKMAAPAVFLVSKEGKCSGRMSLWILRHDPVLTS